jgi:hypothetical protein
VEAGELGTGEAGAGEAGEACATWPRSAFAVDERLISAAARASATSTSAAAAASVLGPTCL